MAVEVGTECREVGQVVIVEVVQVVTGNREVAGSTNKEATASRVEDTNNNSSPKIKDTSRGFNKITSNKVVVTNKVATSSSRAVMDRISIKAGVAEEGVEGEGGGVDVADDSSISHCFWRTMCSVILKVILRSSVLSLSAQGYAKDSLLCAT